MSHNCKRKGDENVPNPLCQVERWTTVLDKEDVQRIWHLVFDVRIVTPKALLNLFACPEYAGFTIAQSIYLLSFILKFGL